MSWETGNVESSGGDQWGSTNEFSTPAETNGASDEFGGGGDAGEDFGGATDGGGFGGECYNCGETG